MNDDRPAFPSDRIEQQAAVHLDPSTNTANPEQIDVRVPQGGMSLRDWFAGMAIQGEIMFQGAAHLSRVMQLVDGSEPLPADDDNPIEALARVAYLRADAMLAAREKGQSDG